MTKPLKRAVLVVSAIAVMVALGAWLVTVTYFRGWHRHMPLQEQLAEGNWIVQQFEQFRKQHGRWPDETEARLLVPGKLMVLVDPRELRISQPDEKFSPYDWTYIPDEPHFVLYRYTGLGRETLWYSDQGFADGVPRWYLQVEGGTPRVVQADSMR